MDALKLLAEQHQEAMDLFEQIEKAKNPKDGRALFLELKSALTLHEKLEETHLYPPLKEESKTEDMVLESYEEHHVMDLLLEEIASMTGSEEQFQPKVKVLQEQVEHHAKEEEEGKLFPKVRQLWNAAKREEIGARMEQMAGGQPARKKVA